MRGLLSELRVDDLRFAAITRRPDLVPEEIEAVELPARSQIWRMASSLPRVLRRLRPALAHFQHALPLSCPCPTVVTVHDLSFERDPKLMGLRDRLVFRTAVPRSARRADRVLAVSERTKHDLMELYDIPAGKIVVTPNGVDPAFSPDGPAPDGAPYALVTNNGSDYPAWNLGTGSHSVTATPYDATNATGTAAACSKVMFAGFSTTARSANTQMYSANAPVFPPKTSSPPLKLVTFLPTASTTPA